MGKAQILRASRRVNMLDKFLQKFNLREDVKVNTKVDILRRGREQVNEAFSQMAQTVTFQWMYPELFE